MRTALPLALAWPLLLTSILVSAVLGSRVENRLFPGLPEGSDRTFAQESDPQPGGAGQASQRIKQTPDALAAEYRFLNFNHDTLNVHFQSRKAALSSYNREYGYSKRDLGEISQWQENARQSIYKLAVKAGKSQAQLDAAMANIKKQYDQKVADYMLSKHCKIYPGQVVEVDVQQTVKDNAPLLKSVAGALDQVAQQKSYDQESVIGAVTSLVQTALVYKVPPDQVGEVHTVGFVAPVQTLVQGWGDCITKTALLGSILANWPSMRMVGVAVPGHYLMAVLRIPGKDEAMVEYNGLQYVLIEPAGPAWLPAGMISEHSQNLMAASEGFRIDPFF